MSDEINESDAMSISEGEYSDNDKDQPESSEQATDVQHIDSLDSKLNAREMADPPKSNPSATPKLQESPIADCTAVAQVAPKPRNIETMSCDHTGASGTAMNTSRTFPLSNLAVPSYSTKASTVDSSSHIYASSPKGPIGKTSHDSWHSPVDRSLGLPRMPMGAAHLSRPMIEPLIDGQWMMKVQRFEESSMPLFCEACFVSFQNRILFEIHMAGLRHLQSCQLAGGERAIRSSGESTMKKLKVTHMLERNVGLLQHLTSLNDEGVLPASLGPASISAVGSSRVENLQKSGDGSLMRNRLSNVVERNVNLFKQLSNRLVDDSSDILPDLPLENPIVKESLHDNANMEEDSIKETRQVSPVGEAHEDTAKTVNTIQADSEVDANDQFSENEKTKEPEETEETATGDITVSAASPPPVYEEPSIPVLGADYVTEYVFLNGDVERTCDLCDINDVTSSVLEHARTTEHILRYMFHQEPEAYRLMSLSGRLSDTGCIHQVAQAIEMKQGCHMQSRVFVESDKGVSDTDDSRTKWTRQEDERVRNVSDLPGHRLNFQYSTRRFADSASSTPVSDVQTLLNCLALQSCLSQGKPPSLQTPVNRLNLFSSISKFDVKNDSDAEVSLQMANILTLSVLTYRMEMLPGLKPADRTKYESRLSRLLCDAQLVATKANSREMSTDSSTKREAASTDATTTLT